MSQAIQIIEAHAVDEKHIELKQPLAKGAGKDFKIAILATISAHDRILESLKQAYLGMTEDEKAFEINLAEEGLAIAPEVAVKNGEQDKWWE